jgi:hypothetical protein
MVSNRDLVVWMLGAAAAAAAVWMLPGTRVAEAQATAQPEPATSAAAAPSADPALLQIVKVACHGTAGICELGKELDVTLQQSVQGWVEATKLSTGDLSLVLSGIPFASITARADQRDATLIRFRLDPDKDADRWKELFVGQDETATFAVALAAPDQPAVVGKTPGRRFVSNAVLQEFDIRPDFETSLIYIFLGALVCGLVVLGRRSDLLRDVGDQPAGGLRKPYSLARTQLALWTVVVVGSYLFIWVVLGSTNPMNSTALILLGLSAATGLTANAIDSQPPAAGPAPQVPTPPPAPTPASQGFLTDLLSDADGVTIYRLQLAIWTLVLAVVFGYSVWTNLAMPEFDAMLLGLLGISNGTYVGFKLPASRT